ncbi:hypothetical protein GCM10009665_63550 [Kitasatospora nipponensis]|uniref:V8-like Glu-specific endopeptidase n=1 Tax=Kitasatospora nipponensis TaxID=258049 RepID=A0ABN1X0Y4_9ACTN
MPSHTPRRAGLTAALATALVLTVSACGSGGSGHTEGLRNWKPADWSRWAQQHLLRNDVVAGLWSVDSMNAATPAPALKPLPGSAPASPSASASATPENDPLPAPVPAKSEPHPYTGNMAVFGKIFTKVPQGSYVCSGTVVSDPQHPGRSNLVWTAGHCLHSGKGGDWLKNIAFIPSYNRSGAASGGQRTTLDQVAPYGRWWADHAMVAPQWTEEGGESGGPVSQYDYGIIRVANPDLPGRSLEEAVGGSVPLWFDAPRERITALTAYGFPATPPFDGQELDYCDGGRPRRLSFDATRPTMLTIGCTMTGGASGGGWLAPGPDGRAALVSNTSIGPDPAGWLAGPTLDDQAQKVFDVMSRLTAS